MKFRILFISKNLIKCLQEILPELLTNQKLELTLPLKVRSPSLTIPYPVILEWQEINQS